MSLAAPQADVESTEQDGSRSYNPSCGICNKIADIDVFGRQAVETSPTGNENWAAFRARFEVEYGRPWAIELCSWAEYVESAKMCGTCEVIVNRFQDMRKSWGCTPQDCVFIASLDSEEMMINVRCKKHTRVQIDLYAQCTIPYTVDSAANTGRRFPAETIDFRTIEAWISDCHKHHHCLDRKNSLFQNLRQPPYLLLIDVKHNYLVKVDKDDRAPYACLSYLWGKPTEPFTTTKENIKDLLEPQSLRKYWNRLPNTIRDAITLLQKIHVRYLWIDRLCIVQNDQEMAREHISCMASIYAQAHFTVVATSGDDDQHGLPGVSPRELNVELLRFGSSGRLLFSKFQGYKFWEEPGNSSWHTRAWTYQERLISSRCLVFYQDSVKWCCNEALWHEYFDVTKSYRQDCVYDKEFQPKVWPDIEEYSELVKDYSGRNLTFSGDALNAFSAVLQCLEPAYPGGFLFGIPEFFFDFLLLWKPEARVVRRDGFPSWSWLGWQGRIDISLHHRWGPKRDRWTSPRAASLKPLVKWYKQDQSSQEKHLINSDYRTWLSYTNDRDQMLSAGWTRRLIRSDDPTLDMPGKEKCETHVFYSHDTLSDAELSVPSSTRWLHPVPISINNEASHVQQWSPYLKTRAQLLNMKVSPRTPSMQKLEDLYGVCRFRYGDFLCGEVFVHHAVGDIHPVIAVAHDKEPLFSLSRPIENEYKPDKREGYVAVLLLRQEKDIWRRLGVGWVDAIAWRQMGPQEVDITLG